MRTWLPCLILALVSTRAYAKDTIVVVLDASGSMNEKVHVGAGGSVTQMELVKQALRRVVPEIKGDVNFGMVVFSAGNLKDDWVYPTGRIVREQAVKAIDAPEPDAGTPLGDYIKIGADELLSRRAKSGNSGRYSLVVVTDGENTQGADPVAYVNEAKRKGLVVHVIGVNMTSEHSLAKAVAANPTPGTYQNAADATSLSEALTRVTAEAPLTQTGSVDPLLFEVTAPLPDKVAAAMVKTLAYYNNQPLGTPDPVTSIDEDGNVVQAQAEVPTWGWFVAGLFVAALMGASGVVLAVLLFIFRE